MERPGFARDAKLPGFDTLRALSDERNTEPLYNESEMEKFALDPHHSRYLDNPAFHRYLKMHKVLLGTSGSRELMRVAQALEGASLPTHIDGAAWAYAEVGLADTSRSATERIAHITKAEQLWIHAASTELQLQSGEYSELFEDTAAAYRLALPLAYTPLMKSIVVGNVTEAVRHQALVDTVAFSSAVAHDIKNNEVLRDRSAKSYLVGFAHELNALSTLLSMDDPRYIPLPSTARADSGYYHRDQTHDIMVVNQHWGVIRKVIPIEVKARPSKQARNRYKALLLRGRMHLSVDGLHPTETSDTYERILDGSASANDIAKLERMSTDVREMLRLYQTGYTPETLAMNSLTRFKKSKQLEQAHPEIAP